MWCSFPEVPRTPNWLLGLELKCSNEEKPVLHTELSCACTLNFQIDESEGKLIWVTALWGHIHFSPAITLLGVELQGHGSRGCRKQKWERDKKGGIPFGDGACFAINCFALVF